jgi:nucleoid-associated protein YgaU
MGQPSSVQKAKLQIEGESTPVDCLFNPKDYTVTKTNGWQAKATPGQSAGKPQFGGGNPHEMTLQLLLDASVTGDGSSVATASTRLFQMMEATIGDGAGSGGNANKKRPPKVTFIWGRFISFAAFAKSLTVQYQLFAPDGQPLRADVKLSLIEAEAGPLPGQNPTTRADGAMGTHTVRAGDSLQAVAYEVYGDPTRWRTIAEANGIDDPHALRRGTALAIPRLDA